MNTEVMLSVTTVTPEQTENVAAKIGANLRGGEVIELVSDLGGGKTTFTRGLVRGTGSQDRVGSPTFTITREYTAPHFKIVHFDFYRLGEAGIVADELAEFINDPEYVVAVEWGEIVRDVLPEKRMTIQFIQAADEGRDIQLSFPSTYAYLIEGLK